MKTKVYDLPVADNEYSLEKKHRELFFRIRRGEVLDPEESDWFDWAEIRLSQQQEEENEDE